MFSLTSQFRLFDIFRVPPSGGSGGGQSTLDFSFDVIDTQIISGTLSTAPGETITVDWGDGTTNTYTGEEQSYSKDYGSAGNRTAHIVGASGALTKYEMAQSGANVSFALSDLPAGLTDFVCRGSNTISGSLSDLPAGLTDFYCSGANTVGGSLSDLPSGMAFFFCAGANTVGGSLSDLPSGMAIFYCRGSNTISGSLSDLPAGMTVFYCSGFNTISDYTAKSWANELVRIYHVPVSPGGLSTAEIDALLIDLAAVDTWSSSQEVYLGGTNAARSAASDAAVATLQGKGVTVTTN